MNYQARRYFTGTTLVELMMAVTIMTIISLAFTSLFLNIGKAIQISKTTTLATNLAQEKMQILKQKPFTEVLVTTAPAYLPPDSVPYDTGYYPPEIILEGGIQFTRYTYIQVVDENSGSLAYLGTASDTGMKSITVTVSWNQGSGLKKAQTNSIMGNINTMMNYSVMKGNISNAGTSTPIPGALVVMAENVGFQDYADSNGAYFINLLPGTYTLNVSAKGFFPVDELVSVPAYTPTVRNYALIAMGSGTVSGTAWINDHLVISQIVASTQNAANFCQEYVELFNPTTYTWTINGKIDLLVQHFGDMAPTPIAMNYNALTVGPSAYYLFSNTSPVVVANTSVIADAVYQPTNLGYPDLIPVASIDPCTGALGTGSADGVGIAWTLNGAWIDRVGWSKNPRNPPLLEGFAVPANGGLGVKDGEQFIRRCSTLAASAGVGRAYDSNNNVADIFDFGSIFMPPNNSLIHEPIISGSPAYGAFITATDGLSQVTNAYKVGLIPWAEFQLTSVATGTWDVFIASSTLFTRISGVAVTPNSTTRIPNSLTNPTWPATNSFAAIISSSATQGYLSGQITDAYGNAISPAITVSANNTITTQANSTNGSYFLPAPPGIYDVSGNLVNPVNNQYVYQTSYTVTVALGQVKTNVNFTLPQGGKISGICTRDGINGIPGVSLTAYSTGYNAVNTQVSDAAGRYLLLNLPVGNYYVTPALDPGEIVTPSSFSAIVSAGVTVQVGTFTISNAFGTIQGAVTSSGQSIRTGVLIVCSTSTLPSGPPKLNNNTLTSMAIYSGNSYEDGTYSLDVRGSTITPYVVNAYFPIFNGTSVKVSSITISGVSVLPGLKTTGVNFGF